MSKLFELVRDHIEAFDEVTQEWETAEGKKTLTRSFSRPVTWIERVHQRGVLTALDCLSIIFFALNDWHTLTTEQEIQLAEGWAAELRQAANAAEIQARDPFTLLPLESIPEGWDWGLAISDVDKFLAARGMSWRCAEIAAHIYNQVASEIDEKRFPEELNSKPTTQAKQAEPQAAPVVAESSSHAPSNGKVWTPEKLAELKAYRLVHTMPETAKKFGISEQRIRQLLPSNKPKTKGYSAFSHHMK